MPPGRIGMGFGVRRGDFRFLILLSLKEKSMHGYALIQEIGRTYQRPVSAGLVYPTLQELGDMELVTVEEKDGKKVYTITEKGKKYLADNQDVVERLKAGREYADKVGQFSFMKEIHDMTDMLMMNSEYVDKNKMERIQEILEDTRKKVAAVIFQ